MTTIEKGESQHRRSVDAASEINDAVELSVSGHTGGLVIIGPSAGELPGIDALLERADVDSVEAVGTRMVRWKTVSAEVLEVGRSASHVIRNGQTAVVYLDSHVGDAPAIPADCRDFVRARLGQVMIGLADVPAFVVIHSESMARALIIDSLGDEDATSVGSIANVYPLWRLSDQTMFPGVCVTVCPGDRPADAMVELLVWFEGRRN